MNTYWRLLSFAKPLSKYAIPYLIFTLIYAIFNTFNFALVVPLMNTLFDQSSMIVKTTQMPDFAMSSEYFRNLLNFLLYKALGENYNTMDVLYFIAMFIVSSCFISNLFRYLGQRKIEYLRIATLQRLRNEVYDNVLSLHTGYFSESRKGDIIAKITSDVQVVQYCITNTLQVAFREPFLIIGYFTGMLLISWELTLFSALFLPVTALIIGFIVKKLRASAKASQETFSDMVTLLDESLTGVKTIKAYGATEFISQKFSRTNSLFSDISRSMARRQQLASPASEFMGITAVAVLMLFAGHLVMAGSLDAGSFVAFLGMFSQITRPVRALTDSFATIHQGIAAGERVLSLLDTRSEIVDKPDAKPLTSFNNKIELRNVTFAYDERVILDNVSFTIERGQTVALVGPSGGGKSTISDLLPRFYDPQQGSILIDGVDLRDYQIESLRQRMGIVSQETILFNDSIENNIKLGTYNATSEQVRAASIVANADEFIMEKEQGYQTVVGDRGMKLSGGQRQRLSIARAVLKNPEILILDEATSALDTESEKLVQEALNTLLDGRTSLVIAHRLSTIHNADKIIVIDKGRIAEQGTHDELMAHRGIYCKLIEMQNL